PMPPHIAALVEQLETGNRSRATRPGIFFELRKQERNGRASVGKATGPPPPPCSAGYPGRSRANGYALVFLSPPHAIERAMEPIPQARFGDASGGLGTLHPRSRPRT